MGAEFTPEDSIGFIRLFALPTKVASMVRRDGEEGAEGEEVVTSD